MTKITLNDVDHRSIAKIVNQYRDLETDLNVVQTKLEELDTEKITLLSTLDKIRAEEIKFFKKLKKTYGDGKLDLLTMEYVIAK